MTPLELIGVGIMFQITFGLSNLNRTLGEIRDTLKAVRPFQITHAISNLNDTLVQIRNTLKDAKVLQLPLFVNKHDNTSSDAVLYETMINKL